MSDKQGDEAPGPDEAFRWKAGDDAQESGDENAQGDIDTEGHSARYKSREPSPDESEHGAGDPDSATRSVSDRNLKRDVEPVEWAEGDAPAEAEAEPADTEGHAFRRGREVAPDDPNRDRTDDPDSAMRWSDRNVKRGIAPVKW